MTWLISNWKILLAVALTGFLAYSLHTCSLTRAIEKQRLATELQCIKSQEITTNAENTFNAGRNQLDNDLSSLPAPSCIKISTTSGSDATNQPNKPSHRDAVNTDILYKFAAACEVDRLKVIALQQFIKDERK